MSPRIIELARVIIRRAYSVRQRSEPWDHWQSLVDHGDFDALEDAARELDLAIIEEELRQATASGPPASAPRPVSPRP